MKKRPLSVDRLPPQVDQKLPEGEIREAFEVLHRDRTRSTEVVLERTTETLHLQYGPAGDLILRSVRPKMVLSNADGFDDSDLELIDEDIADLFEDDPMYNGDLAMDDELFEEDLGEYDDQEDWENMILDEAWQDQDNGDGFPE